MQLELELLLSGKARAATGTKTAGLIGFSSWFLAAASGAGAAGGAGAGSCWTCSGGGGGAAGRSNIQMSIPMTTEAARIVSHRSNLSGLKNIHMLSGLLLFKTKTTPDSE